MRVKTRLGTRKINIFLPNAVQNPSVWKNSHVDVGHDNVMEMAFTFVGKEEIGHPDFARVVECQILHST